VNVYDGSTFLGTATASGTGAWSFTTIPLPDGQHSLTATDTVSGMTSAASAVMNVTIDTVAPSVPIIATDAAVNTNEILLTGTAEANATVTVYDNGALLGSVLADHNGGWNYTTGPLSAGAQTFTATATDAAGNTSATSQPVDPIVGTIAPATPTILSF